MERASALVPALKDRASDAERLRRLPDENVADLLASGLYRIAEPQRFGGLDVDYALVLDVAEELARGCPATGWCYGLWAAHAWLVGYWPLPTQQEVFADDPDALISSSLNTGKSTCTPVADGYCVSGRWEFSSGCDFANWLMIGLSGVGERTWALIPKNDFEIVDTWFVSGLRGSGSKDVVVTDAFVPAHRVLDVPTAGDGNYSGWDIHRQSRYRAPITVLLGWDLVAPLLGIAQGMIDEFIARLSGTSGTGRTAESQAVHIRLSQTCAEVDAARALVRQDVREILDRAESGQPYPTLDRARYRRDKAYATSLCLQAVNRLFDVSGGHALFDSSALQRHHRDAHAAAHRDTLTMDFAGQDFGRLALRLRPDRLS